MNTELRIAVIGAGPAGVYSSDIFLRQLKKLGEELGLGTEARIDLFEKLPVPFGLVRYGVAPDHPSIKFIASALEKTLDNPNIHLYCDVEFGKDVTLDDLLARYDAVLFATGAVKDKPLNLPGADLEGVYGAAKFVEWYDGYPTGAREWPLTAENVAVIGGGNVAMDVARELMRNADDLKVKTDIPDNVYEGIGQNKAKVLHLFIRRGVAQAKFSVQELREMEKLPGVQLIINEDDFDLDDETIEVAGKDKLTRQMVEELFAIREMAEDMEDDGDVDFEGNPADESTTCTSTPPPPRFSARTARSRPSAWSAPKPVPTARCTAPASSPTTRLRPSTTPSVTSPPKPPALPTTSTAPTWPTPTATAASPPRPTAAKCATACTPPVGPSAARWA